MLLSDRDLKAALAEGRMGLAPYDEAMVQPSSVDVRLDRFFRVFANHRYTHIDPAVAQDDLTELLEPEGEEPFILHPGEFVLGSTLEVITLGNDLAARLELSDEEIDAKSVRAGFRRGTIGSLLGQVIAEQGGEALFTLVERIRRRMIALHRGDPELPVEPDATPRDRAHRRGG